MATSHFVLLAALSVFVLHQTSAVTFCNTVNVPTVRKCYQTYMASFNVKMGNDIPEYWVFRNARSDLFKKNGLYEQSLNCQYTLSLLNCLDSNFECFGQDTYLALGASNNTESIDYWTDLLINQYQCTDQGNKLKTNNFNCYENCRKDQSSAIDACHAALSKNLHGNMELCKALQTNADCQTAIQRKCCGSEAAVLACNTELAASRASSPTCSEMGKVSCPTK